MTPEERSALMGRIRSKDTKPELTVRRALHAAGLRYRLHVKHLPGKPDLVFPSRRLVVFVHGCFWHAHSDPDCPETHKPKSRSEYWNPKLSGNVARDARHVAVLDGAGWSVLTIWECEIGKASFLDGVASDIASRPRLHGVRSQPGPTEST